MTLAELFGGMDVDGFILFLMMMGVSFCLGFAAGVWMIAKDDKNEDQSEQ